MGGGVGRDEAEGGGAGGRCEGSASSRSVCSKERLTGLNLRNGVGQVRGTARQSISPSLIHPRSFLKRIAEET